MSLRKLTFYLYYWSDLHFVWPLVWLQKWLTYRRVENWYGKIALLDSNEDDADDETFFDFTKEALDLIQCHDPQRFRIIEREIRCIVNREYIAAASYDRPLRACRIDFGRFPIRNQDEHHEWYLALYATMLVHEATHGRLLSLYFPYTKATRVRVERICNSEERRFARRLTSERYNFSKDLVPAFSESNWDYDWKTTRGQKLRALFARIRESRNESNSTSSRVDQDEKEA